MRPALVLLLFFGLGLAACRTAAPPTEETRPALNRHFAAYGVEGCFVLYDPQRRRFVRSDADRCRERHLPASSFKIFNSLVALETGVAPDENFVLEWDGVDRGSDGWNQSQDLKTALRRSTVWYYQETARRVGPERMKQLLEASDYGNADISDGIDQFWLKGSLRISPDEQIAFLRRLHARELDAFSDRTQRIVNEILPVIDEEAGVRGKTGWGRPGGDKQIGWLVGYVERGDAVYFYALNLTSDDPDFPMREARQKIVLDSLRELGVLD